MSLVDDKEARGKEIVLTRFNRRGFRNTLTEAKFQSCFRSANGIVPWYRDSLDERVNEGSVCQLSLADQVESKSKEISQP